MMKTPGLPRLLSLLGLAIVGILVLCLPVPRTWFALHLHRASLTDADALLARAERTTSQIEDPVEQITLWLQLAGVYHDLGNQNKEREILAHANEYCDAQREQILNPPRPLEPQEEQICADRLAAFENFKSRLEFRQPSAPTDDPSDKSETKRARYSNINAYYSVPLSAAIRTLLNAGKTELAIKQVSKEVVSVERGRLLMAMGWQQIERDDYAGARQLYLRARATTYGDFDLDVLTRAGVGDYQGCVKAYKDTKDPSGAPGSFDDSGLMAETYAPITAIFAKAGNIAALQALNQFDNVNSDFDTSPQIVEIFLRKGDIASALNTARAEQRGVEVRQELLGKVALAYARKGDFPAAINLAQTLQQPDAAMQELHHAEGGGLTPFYRDITLKDIAGLQAAATPDAALETLDKIHESAVLSDALGEVAAILVQNGHEDQAVKSIKDIAGDRNEVRRTGMMGLARSLAQAKNGNDQVLALANGEAPYIQASLLIVLSTEMRRHKPGSHKP